METSMPSRSGRTISGTRAVVRACPVTPDSGPIAHSDVSSSRTRGMARRSASTPTSIRPCPTSASDGRGTHTSPLHAPSGLTAQPVRRSRSPASTLSSVRIIGRTLVQVGTDTRLLSRRPIGSHSVWWTNEIAGGASRSLGDSGGTALFFPSSTAGGDRGRRHRRWAYLAPVLAVLSAMVPFVALPGPAAHASPESPNLLGGDHGSCDLTTGGWVGGNASVAHVTSPTQAGLGALAMAATSAGTAGAVSGNGPTTWTPAQAGQGYTGSAWTEAASTGRPVDRAVGVI